MIEAEDEADLAINSIIRSGKYKSQEIVVISGNSDLVYMVGGYARHSRRIKEAGSDKWVVYNKEFLGNNHRTLCSQPRRE